MSGRISILGRFPPPIDGQSLATERLASLLETERTVQKVDLAAHRGRFTQSRVTFRPRKLYRYTAGVVERNRALRVRGPTPENEPILWTSVSPSFLGHWRDLLTVLPTIPEDRPLYAVVHWGSFERLFRRLDGRYSSRFLRRRVDRFVFLSDRLADRCAEWIPSSQRAVVPNTVDREAIPSAAEVERARERRIEHGGIRLLFLSNMTASKGYEDVLKAVDLLRDEPFHCTADFVGRWESSEQRRSFLRAISERELKDRVTCHGPITSRERIRDFYLEADLFVLPTYYATEAFPLTILEALSAGTPVITTRHAGIPDMVRENREARFVPPRSPRSIAQAVRILNESARWRRASVAARDRFDRRFRPDRVRERWLDLLNRDLPS